MVQRLIGSKSLEDFRLELDVSTQRATQQLLQRAPSERNYKVLNHVVGIERWGLARLQRVLIENQPLTPDSLEAGPYDPYRPPLNLSWNELQDEFAATREKTFGLIDRLSTGENSFLHARTVLHDEWGPLTLFGWLAYLRFHAEGEFWKMN